MSKPQTIPTAHPGVFQTPTGWYLTACVIGPSGRETKRRRTLGPCPLGEAVDAREALLAELTAAVAMPGATPPPSPKPTPARTTPAPSRPTLSEYAVAWLVSKAPRLKASVREHYTLVVSTRIAPELLDRHVDTLVRADVDLWARWIEAQHKESGEAYSTATLATWWRPICTMLRDAAADHRFPDPIQRVRPPRGGTGRRRERRTLTEQDLARLLEAVEARFPAWVTEVRVLVFSGLRAGELYALEWGDIDTDAGVIHVSRAVWRGHLGRTKTDDPRDIALTPALRKLLEAHREAQGVRPRGARPLVFPTARGGFRGASALYRRLAISGEAAGLAIKVGPQALRRTFNTLMLTAGVDRVVLRSQMGHSNEEMTQRYAHVNAELKQAAVGDLEDRVRARRAPASAGHPDGHPQPTPPTTGAEKEKALGIQGLFRERDTGFEPATFSLGS